MGRRKTLTDGSYCEAVTASKPLRRAGPGIAGALHSGAPNRRQGVRRRGARAPSGKQVWHTIGRGEPLQHCRSTRAKAREAIKAIREGRDRDGP